MTTSVFITGTDTDVGKTVITAGLARLAVRLGMKPGVMKPVASGCTLQDGRLLSADTLQLLAAAGSGQDPAEVTPYAFREPLSPHLAARLDGHTLAGAEMTRTIRAALSGLLDTFDPVLVEGVGGFHVPLADDLVVADLCAELELPLLVVAANRLGVISHTLLTLEAARSRGVPVWAVILNGGAPDDAAAQSNGDALRAVTEVPVVGPVPRLACPEDADAVADALAAVGADAWLRGEGSA